VSKEVAALHYQEPLRDVFPEWSYGLLGILQESHQSLRRLWSHEARTEVLSRHTNWDTTSLCRRLSESAEYQYSVDELLQTLTPNFETFTDEYSLGSPVKTYRFEIHTTEEGELGTNGVDGRYKETTRQHAERFAQEKVAKAGKRQQRAAVESVNSDRLDQWIPTVLRDNSISLGTKLVWFSPPGYKVEGYHGTSPKHHSFVWVYEKRQDESSSYVEMTQYRCWPTLEQLKEVQKLFKARSINTGALPQFTSLFPLSERNTIIANMFELPATMTDQEIERTIYSSASTWKVQPKQMPHEQLSEELLKQFFEQRTTLLREFLEPTYRRLLKDPIIEQYLVLPFSHPFWTSSEYRTLIHQLDFSFGLAKQALDKWIENALNSQSPTDIPLKHLESLFQLGSKHAQTGLDKKERQQFNSLAPTVLAKGNRLLSIGQCGIGTVIPTQLTSQLQLTVSSSGLPALHSTPISALEKLSHEHKEQFREALARYAPFEVLDKHGTSHRFWVLREYLSDYQGQCYENDDGLFIGPCGVPLTMEDDEFILTDEKYRELLHVSQAQQTKDSLDAIAHDEQNELSKATSDAEKAAIRSKYDRLRSRFKHRVSITELINDDVAA
jgi:hypothetical protein